MDLLSGPLLAADASLFSLPELCLYTTFEPQYYCEMEMVLTWLNWQEPLAVHGVRVAALLKEGK